MAASPWKLVYQTKFPTDVPLGGFDSAGNCPALAGEWTSYQSSWPDTATQRNYPVGGYYDPATTVWIANKQMHIKLWRGAGGNVHSCAMVPVQAQGRKYGCYVESFRVSQIAPGYKSAHLLWPSDGDQNATSFEVDYPENEWDTDIYAYVHAADVPGQQSFRGAASWGVWHQSEIRWTPESLTFLMDGKTIGETTQGVPDINMDWIIQNESALNGEVAAPNTAAEIVLGYVAYFEYVG